MLAVTFNQVNVVYCIAHNFGGSVSKYGMVEETLVDLEILMDKTLADGQ